MTTVEEVLDLMGGARVLGKVASGSTETLPLIEFIEEGLPFESIDQISDSIGITRDKTLELIGLPKRTYARRKKQGRLGLSESDRLFRLARIFVRAKAVLGSVEKAGRWLRKRNRALGNRMPLDLLGTDFGAHQVEKILGRIQHGIFG